MLLMGGCLAGLAGFGLWATNKVTSEFGDLANLPRQAANEARLNQEVIAVLGQPIEAGGVQNSQYNRRNSETEVEFQVTLTGPNGSGILKVRAFRDESKGQAPFKFKRLTFTPESANANTIELVGGEP